MSRWMEKTIGALSYCSIAWKISNSLFPRVWTTISISRTCFIFVDHAPSMIAVNDCVRMNLSRARPLSLSLSLWFSLSLSVPRCKYDTDIYVYPHLSREWMRLAKRDSDREGEGERERENLNTHQRRDTSERLHTYTLANYDYDTRVCARARGKRVSATNERTNNSAREFFFLIRWNTRTNSSNSLGNLADHLYASWIEREREGRKRRRRGKRRKRNWLSSSMPYICEC